MRVTILFKTLLFLVFIIFSSCSPKLSNGVSVQKRSYKKGCGISSSNNIELAVQSNKTESSKVFVKTINDRSTSVSNLISNKADSKKLFLKKKISEKLMVSKLNSSANYVEDGEKCDSIILKNGKKLSVQLLEINETNIVYKKCSYLTGPSYTKSKSAVFMVLYSNGTKDTFVSDYKNDSKKTIEGLDDAPLAYGGIGLFLSIVFPIPPLGLIFGCIGLFKYKKNPDKSTKIAKYVCLASIISGLILTLLMVAYISFSF